MTRARDVVYPRNNARIHNALYNFLAKYDDLSLEEVRAIPDKVLLSKVKRFGKDCLLAFRSAVGPYRKVKLETEEWLTSPDSRAPDS